MFSYSRQQTAQWRSLLQQPSRSTPRATGSVEFVRCVGLSIKMSLVIAPPSCNTPQECSNTADGDSLISFLTLTGLPDAVLSQLVQKHMAPLDRLRLFQCSRAARDAVLQHAPCVHITLENPRSEGTQLGDSCRCNELNRASSLSSSMELSLVSFKEDTFNNRGCISYVSRSSWEYHCLTSLRILHCHLTDHDIASILPVQLPCMHTLVLHSCSLQLNSNSTPDNAPAGCIESDEESTSSLVEQHSDTVTQLRVLECLRCQPHGSVICELLKRLPAKHLQHMTSDEVESLALLAGLPELVEYELAEFSYNTHSPRYSNMSVVSVAQTHSAFQHPNLTKITLPKVISWEGDTSNNQTNNPTATAEITDSSDDGCQQQPRRCTLRLSKGVSSDVLARLPLDNIQTLQIDGIFETGPSIDIFQAAVDNLSTVPEVEFRAHINWRHMAPPEPVFVFVCCQHGSEEYAQLVLHMLALSKPTPRAVCFSNCSMTEAMVSGLFQGVCNKAPCGTTGTSQPDSNSSSNNSNDNNMDTNNVQENGSRLQGCDEGNPSYTVIFDRCRCTSLPWAHQLLSLLPRNVQHVVICDWSAQADMLFEMLRRAHAPLRVTCAIDRVNGQPGWRQALQCEVMQKPGLVLRLKDPWS